MECEHNNENYDGAVTRWFDLCQETARKAFDEAHPDFFDRLDKIAAHSSETDHSLHEEMQNDQFNRSKARIPKRSTNYRGRIKAIHIRTIGSSFSEFIRTHVFGILLLTHLLGLVIGVLVASWCISSSLASGVVGYYVMVAPIGFLLLLVVAFCLASSRTKVADEARENSLMSHLNKVVETIEKKLTPVIFPLNRTDQVHLNATQVVQTALDSPDGEVIYVGAAGITSRDTPDGEIGNDSTQSRYKTAIGQVMGRRISIKRYVALLTTEEYHQLPLRVRKNYDEWIKRQIFQCEQNPNYQLYSSSKAPGWGSANNTIATPNEMVILVGNGMAGIRIKGEQIVTPLLDSWTRLFEAKDAKLKLYDKDSLQRYLEHDLKTVPLTIRQLFDREEVFDTAATLIDGIFTNGTPASKVVYNGSGDLVTGTYEGEAQQRYSQAVARLMKSKVNVERYICLLAPEDFRQRGLNTKKGYLKWIESQMRLLEDKSNYAFFHCPRAQSWGSSRSTIVSTSGMVDIIGNGDMGIQLTGSYVGAAIQEAFRELFRKSPIKPEKLSSEQLYKYAKDL